MDSITQFALGAAVGVAAMGRRTALWKAALWGGIAGTLPDLDVFIDHGDPILNMVQHRAETHAPFWLTLFSLPFALAVARLNGDWALWRRWWLAIWLALVTHPLLDAMTIYGTQLALPFSDRPYSLGSVYIIDLLYTLPLIVGVTLALRRRRLAWNAAGLLLSTAYLGWSVWAQMHVEQIARKALQVQGIAAERVLVMPTAFNSVLWRVVVLDGVHYREGFRSLLDTGPKMAFDPFDRGIALQSELMGLDGVRRIADFSHGFYKLHAEGEWLRITDLRMGQEPAYIFSFIVAERHSPPAELRPSVQKGGRPDIGRVLPWLWRRAAGEQLPPPR